MTDDGISCKIFILLSGFKNNLPKFSVGGVSELVVTVKEGSESLGEYLP